MKKAVSFILAFVLLLVSTVANATSDYSSMTDDQLKEQFDSIRNELVVRRLKAEEKTVLCDRSGVKFYINGDIRLEKRYPSDSVYSLFVPVVCVNDSSYVILIVVNQASINGWSTDSGNDIETVPAGKKAKGNLIFDLTDTEVETMEDFTDLEFVFRIYDQATWEVFFTTKPITIYADK